MQVRNQLAERTGGRFSMISVSIDPLNDRPEQLREMRERHGIVDEADKPAWVFCTGTEEDVKTLRKSLGLWDPDPAVDEDKSQHAGAVVYGDDKLDRWSVAPALIEPRRLTEAVLRRLQLDGNGRPGPR